MKHKAFGTTDYFVPGLFFKLPVVFSDGKSWLLPTSSSELGGASGAVGPSSCPVIAESIETGIFAYNK